MHFLRATIFSIAALAFTASASAVSWPDRACHSDSDCDTGYKCQGASGGVRTLLLLVRSELTHNHFTGVWNLHESSSMVKEFNLKWNENQGELRQNWYSLNSNWWSPDILPIFNRPHQTVIYCSRLFTSRVQFDMNGYYLCLSLSSTGE